MRQPANYLLLGMKILITVDALLIIQLRQLYQEMGLSNIQHFD